MIKLFNICAVSVLLYSCANIGSLGGGPADTTAPVIVKTNLKDSLFRDRFIEIEFNEYVVLNNPEKNISILPFHSKLKCEIQNRKLIIRFEDSLQRNTTYTLLINKGIADNNAGNPFVWKKVFTTGLQKDTGKIEFEINNPEDYKNLRLSILPHQAEPDSFRRFNAFYSYEIAADRILSFNGLKALNFDAWLFTDANSDYHPDPFQPLAFIQNIQTDSIYQLYPLKWNKPFTITGAQFDGRYYKLKYENWIAPELIPELSGYPSSAFLYYNSDSALIDMSQLSKPSIADTAKPFQIQTELSNQVMQTVKLYAEDQAYHLFYKVPQCYIENKQAQNYQEVHVKFAAKPEHFHRYNYITQRTDTFSLKETATLKASEKSFMSIEIDAPDSAYYELSITNKDGKEIIYYNRIKKLSQFLEPGAYQIKIRAANSRLKFNPYLHQNINSVIYEKSLYLKGSWEEILQIKL